MRVIRASGYSVKEIMALVSLAYPDLPKYTHHRAPGVIVVDAGDGLYRVTVENAYVVECSTRFDFLPSIDGEHEA